MKSLLSAAALLLIGMTPANAGKDQIELGYPGYAGSGCPSGSASITLSPDKTELSLLFDEYIVEAGGFTGKRVARKTCNVSIPVKVPQGFAVSIIDVDYRGFNSLPRRSQAKFTAEYFFAGERGPKLRKVFRGPLDDEFMISNQLAMVSTVWSKCGDSVNLRVNSSMMIKNLNRNDEALSMVDSADFKSGIIYHLKWKKCKSHSNDSYYDDFFDDF